MLKNMNADGNVFVNHPMIEKLKEAAEHTGIVIKHADFDTGKIIVTVEGKSSSFEDVMSSLEFVAMIERMSIHAVDFETGEITVEWHDEGVTRLVGGFNVTREEIETIKSGKFINAIKDIRQRTGLGLADAKKLAEDAREELRRRGVMR